MKAKVAFMCTLFVKMDQDVLPWEFNLLPFFTIAENPKFTRIKFGWLWFYWVILKEKA